MRVPEIHSTREIGELSVVASLPSVVVVLFAVITQLADTWFVFSLLSMLYVWPALGLRRRETARLIALALAAAAVVLALKTAIAVPRPPGSTVATVPGWLPWPLSDAFHSVATDDGFGFPSGHATAATVLYGGLAATIEWGRRRTRVGIASVIILAVMCSRVVLGLHFLVDVLAGGVLAGSLLWLWLRGGTPTQWFGLAAVAAVVGGVIAVLQGHPAEVHDAAIGAGSAIGGAIGWTLLRQRGRAQQFVVQPVAGIAVGGVAAVTWVSAYVFGAELTTVSSVGGLLALLVVAVTAAVAIALIVGLPALLLRWERRRESAA